MRPIGAAPRRMAVVASATGLLLALAGAAGWADTGGAGGSGSLGGFSLSARAHAFDTTQDSSSAPTHPEGESNVPETLATLGTGPLGFAQSAVIWPGTLAGNLGNTIILGSGGAAPPFFTVLNDPVRAEARTPQGPKDASFDQTSAGVAMQAHAVADDVHATGTLKSVEAPGIGSVGNVSSDSRTRLTASSGTSDASSHVADVVLGPAGLIHLAAVTSRAHAVTDGLRATGSATTTVSGLTVAGQPATVDERGVHFGPASDPTNQRLNDLAAQALKASKVSVLLGKSLSTPGKGAAIAEDAGPLIVAFATPQGVGTDEEIVVMLGGANAEVNAVRGDSGTSILPQAGPVGLVGGAAGGSADRSGGGGAGSAILDRSGGQGGAAASDSVGSTAVGSGAGLGAGGIGSAAGPPGYSPGGSPVPASGSPGRLIGFSSGVGVPYVVVILLGALLAGWGLRRVGAGALVEAPIGAL
ncbi:MAG: choice-of-anchor P family protein, partial [Acidimicrobiales bacterium]